MITQKYLKSRLWYEPDTGLFYWVKLANNHQRRLGKTAGFRNGEYRQIKLGNQTYLAHRLAWLYIYGYLPPMLDHINRKKSDNRINNLRCCSTSQNGMNQKPKKRALPTGVCKHLGKFQADIGLNNKSIYLGRYATAHEASDAYQKARVRLFGEFA